jgi:hypothetical protein
MSTQALVSVAPAPCASRELDRRTGDGVDVRMLWRPSANRVTVVVHDAVTGDRFDVEVLPTDRAYDVFDNPFAYAALRGIDTSGVDTAPVLAALLATGPR